MIICLIGIGICVILGLISLYKDICERKEDKWYNEWYNTNTTNTNTDDIYYQKYEKWKKAHSWITESIASIAIGVTVILCFLYGIVFLAMKGQGNCDYEKALDTKSQIEYILENDIVTDEDKDALLVRAIEVNNKIRYYKRIQNNIWVNWFGTSDFENMKEIDFNDFI